MNIPAEFNEIRPYTPEELPQIYEELIADPAFRTVVESVMPGVPFEGLAMKMRQCKTNLEFQKAFFYGLLWDLVKKTANGLTFDCSALSDLTRNYTFISHIGRHGSERIAVCGNLVSVYQVAGTLVIVFDGSS